MKLIATAAHSMMNVRHTNSTTPARATSLQSRYVVPSVLLNCPCTATLLSAPPAGGRQELRIRRDATRSASEPRRKTRQPGLDLVGPCKTLDRPVQTRPAATLNVFRAFVEKVADCRDGLFTCASIPREELHFASPAVGRDKTATVPHAHIARHPPILLDASPAGEALRCAAYMPCGLPSNGFCCSHLSAIWAPSSRLVGSAVCCLSHGCAGRRGRYPCVQKMCAACRRTMRQARAGKGQ